MRKLHQRPSGAKLSVIIAAIVFFAVAATFGLNTGVGYFTQKSALAENTLSLNAKQGGRSRTVAYKPEPLVSANSG
ncbi:MULTISPECIES: hypothetical protein [Cohnella]|uniref:hypothetical protein n=1 Tax=Cohnella TaxID=329857 RepID=UPI0009BA3142|nr:MULTISPECIES: hypothetical protein [Cohnella]MBN2982070.1 hypothetical protein [Cohnella algarum]